MKRRKKENKQGIERKSNQKEEEGKLGNEREANVGKSKQGNKERE